MKRTFALYLAFALFILTGCAEPANIEAKRPEVNENYYADYKIEYLISQDITTFVKSFEFIDDEAQYIFKGYILDDGKPDLQYVGGGKAVGIGCTFCTMVVTDVIRGQLKKGDEIPFIEPYYISDVSGEDVIYCDGNYSPSIPGKEYLFFANKLSKGRFADRYVAIGVEYGRYPMIDKAKKSSIDTLTTKELNIGGGDTAKYKEVFDDVMDKYEKYLIK